MGRNPLALLDEFGQSIWCDDIGRDLLLAGRLQALIDDDGARGSHRTLRSSSGPSWGARAMTRR